MHLHASSFSGSIRSDFGSVKEPDHGPGSSLDATSGAGDGDQQDAGHDVGQVGSASPVRVGARQACPEGDAEDEQQQDHDQAHEHVCERRFVRP